MVPEKEEGDILAETREDPVKDSFLKKWLNRLLQLIVIGLLVWQLTEVGWAEVIKNLPTNPLFYILQFFIYLALPISEVLIYRRRWKFRIKDALPLFIYKKIYNADVMTYSGEVYLYYWARTSFNTSKREVLELIRDNNILSSVASTMLAIVLVGLFLMIGHINLLDLIDQERRLWIPWISGLFLILAAVGWHFRKYLFSMPRKEAGIVFGINIGRVMVINVFQLLQWIVGMPSVAVSHWFSLLAIQIIGNRIPFLPNKDLLFTAVALGISGSLGLPQAELASLLLIPAVMNKVLNLVFFALIGMSPALKSIQKTDAEKPEKIDRLELR